ncbi:MFS transporter [Brachybacterium huguangmaarense]
MTAFRTVLVNTLLANVTTSFLWFALTFWVYLETRSVLATGVIGGSYMGLVALCSIGFGVIVDHNRKKKVMVMAQAVTVAAYAIGGIVWLALPHSSLLEIRGWPFWVFAGVILAGSVVENMRNVALSTTVTLLVPDGERDKANGLVGAVQGIAFMVTSVFSGLAIGFLGMGPTLLIAILASAAALAHLLPIAIPEERIVTTAEAAAAVEGEGAEKDGAETDGAAEGAGTAEGADGAPDRPDDVVSADGSARAGAAPAPVPGPAGIGGMVDLRGTVAAIRAVPGLGALILFACFNNLVGGVYMALMDPYGLELMSAQAWGIVLGLTSTGFIVGGAIVSKTGLGTNPVRTLLLVNVGVCLVGATFALREWWILFAVGMWVFMCIMPAAEAAEQTILQRVVPFERQGRVFGFAQTIETAASPVSSFLAAILAQSVVIPWMRDGSGAESLRWLLGTGHARGMALMFVLASLVMLVAVVIAFLSPQYRALSAHYARVRQSVPVAEGPGVRQGP